MKRHKIIIPFLALSLLLSGCGSGSASRTTSARNDSFSNSYSMKQSYNYDSVIMEDMASVETGAINGEPADDLEQTISEVQEQTRKLIKNVSLEMESTDLEKTISEIKINVEQVNGYIEYSNISGQSYNSNESRYSQMKIRIPQDKLDQFMNAAETSGNVKNKIENISDITLQYSDTEDHIKALETEQTRLFELMEQADSIESVIAIEERLSEVRYNLGAYESQMKIYDNQVDYSTVDIRVNEVKVYTAKDRDGAGARIVAGFKQSCEFIKVFMIDLFVFLASYSPIIALIAAIIFVIIKIIIATECRKKSKNKSSTKTELVNKSKENKRD